jgi:hypothetical protein
MPLAKSTSPLVPNTNRGGKMGMINLPSQSSEVRETMRQLNKMSVVKRILIGDIADFFVSEWQ